MFIYKRKRMFVTRCWNKKELFIYDLCPLIREEKNKRRIFHIAKTICELWEKFSKNIHVQDTFSYNLSRDKNANLKKITSGNSLWNIFLFRGILKKEIYIYWFTVLYTKITTNLIKILCDNLYYKYIFKYNSVN